MESDTEIERPKESGKRKVAGVITPRDVSACLWVCEQGCMTVEQIYSAVWWTDQSRGPRYAYKRVLFLERAGYLSRVTTNQSLKSYFRATRMGQELAASQSHTSASASRSGVSTDQGGAFGASYVPLASPPINEIPHAHTLTELRLSVLRAGRCQSWRPDRVLVLDPGFPRVRFYGIIPDALWVTPSGNRIAVEYERTRKGLVRVRAKVEALSREMARGDRVIDQVLWVAEKGAHLDLKAILATHPNQTLRTVDQFTSELTKASANEERQL